MIKPTKLGIALVESYAKLGFTLHLPELRAKMEAKMNEIARGQRVRESMVTETITEMEGILRQLQTKS